MREFRAAMEGTVTYVEHRPYGEFVGEGGVRMPAGDTVYLHVVVDGISKPVEMKATGPMREQAESLGAGERVKVEVALRASQPRRPGELAELVCQVKGLAPAGLAAGEWAEIGPEAGGTSGEAA